MRKIHTIALALIGVALGVGTLSFALAANTAAPALTRRAIMPGVAGDNSVFIPGSGTSTPTPEVGGCAGLRTNVKILADSAAGFDRTAVASSLFALVNEPRPDGITDGSARFAPFESRVVEITASLVGYKRTAGGGIDLVITQGGGGDIMLVSFPSQSCLAGTNSSDGAAVNSARIALMQQCGNPPDSGVFKPLGGSATIQGVPFWGPKRTDGSGAPSGVELGPALKFTFNPATSCDANASKTPYPTATATPVVTQVLISVSPQQAHPGDEIVVTIIMVPLASGRLCGYQLWDSEVTLVSSAELAPTGSNGRITWNVTLPSDIHLGVARVQPVCPGLPTNGSAPLAIVP
ncbi:MAG: hypothetical protein ABI577_13555 [bacterium]